MNAKISTVILAKVAAGMSLEAAVNSVLGAGMYKQIAGEVYDGLRK